MQQNASTYIVVFGYVTTPDAVHKHNGEAIVHCCRISAIAGCQPMKGSRPMRQEVVPTLHQSATPLLALRAKLILVLCVAPPMDRFRTERSVPSSPRRGIRLAGSHVSSQNVTTGNVATMDDAVTDSTPLMASSGASRPALRPHTPRPRAKKSVEVVGLFHNVRRFVAEKGSRSCPVAIKIDTRACKT